MSNQHTLYINHTPSGLARQTDRVREKERERGRKKREGEKNRMAG